MIKYFIITILGLLVILIAQPASNAEVLQAQVSDSTGIVGLDMAIGAEPVPVIMNVFPGTPASKAGIRPGDRIVAIDNSPAYGLNIQQVDIAIPDIPGEKVTLSILRNNQYINFELEVAPLHLIKKETRSIYDFLFARE